MLVFERVYCDNKGDRKNGVCTLPWTCGILMIVIISIVVSINLQFTLYSILKGNKPDFHSALGGEESEQFYNNFVEQMKAAYIPDLVKG